MGSSASLKSRSNPRDWRELKKSEWEDLSARSSSKTRTRRLEAFSGEKEVQRIAMRGIRVRKMKSFDIFLVEMIRVFGLGPERVYVRESFRESGNGEGWGDLGNYFLFRG